MECSFPSFGSSLSPRPKRRSPFFSWEIPPPARAPFFASFSPSYSSVKRSPIRCFRLQDGCFSGPNPTNSKARWDQNGWLSGFSVGSAVLVAHVVSLSRHFLNLHFNTLMNKVREAFQYAVTVTPKQFNLDHFVVGAVFILMWTFLCYTWGRNSATKGPNTAPVLYGPGVATMNFFGNRGGEASPAQPIFIVPSPAQLIFIIPSPAQPIFIIPGNNMFFNLNFFSGWSYTNWNLFKF